MSDQTSFMSALEADYESKEGTVKLYSPDLDRYFWVDKVTNYQSSIRAEKFFQEGKSIDVVVEVMISRMKNEDGSKMLSEHDRIKLKTKADKAVLDRIVKSIMEVDGTYDQAEIEKNLGTTV